MWRPPFTRNPESVWKLLLISAILGILTALISYYSLVIFLDGGFEDMELYGSVSDPEGQPIDNATVTIMGSGLNATTDPGGQYHLSGLESGTHTVRIQAEGYYTRYYTFTLLPEGGSSERVRRDFILQDEGTGTGPLKNVDESVDKGIYFVPGLMMICGTISFLGALSARKFRHRTFCVMSAVAGIFSFGLIIVSPILCILAIVILNRTRYAFDAKR